MSKTSRSHKDNPSKQAEPVMRAPVLRCQNGHEVFIQKDQVATNGKPCPKCERPMALIWRLQRAPMYDREL